jgi:WD40 repeat protein
MLASLVRERELLDRLMSAGAQGQWSDRVVKLFGHNLDSPVPFLVYEYVPGGNLIHRLAAVRKQSGVNLRPAQVLGLVRRICEAVAFVHQRGLVHRDIKPSNILVSGNTIKLADFGLGGVVADFAARANSGGSGQSVSDKCSHFRGAGTPLYMSPEQRRGDAPDPRHDIYSIGVMWYQLLVGDYTRELHQGWANELTEELDIPAKHVELIHRCVGLFKKRSATAAELLAALPSPTAAHVPPIRAEQVGQLRTLEGHESRVNSLAFTRDGRHLLSGASDGTARLWDADTGRELACYRVGANVSCVAVSPDGRRALLGCGDFTARLWDLARGSELSRFTGHARAVNGVAFSPDGRRAVTGGADAGIRLWHVASAREILRFDEHRKEVSSLTFTPDGLFVLSCSQDGALCLWDSETGWETQQLPGTGDWPLCVAVSQDGRRAACGGVEKLGLWDLEGGRSLGTFDGHVLPVMSAQFTPNCRWLLSGSLDKTVRLWDVSSRRLLHLFEGHSLGVNAIAVSPDSRHAASAGLDRVIRVWALPQADSFSE